MARFTPESTVRSIGERRNRKVTIMGGGSWNVGSYDARISAAAAAGKSTFDYSDSVRSGKATGVNALLDPTQKAGPNSPFAGKVMREVCVTDEHPDPTAIQIWLDVTGSNISAARVVHSKLPELQAYLKNGNFCADPQINIGAIGDATSDDYPLQWGQFESDNRLDEQIEAVILEGNGGGQQRETYELGAYMSARHVHLEPYELFGKKGFVFFFGDEMPYQTIQNDYSRTHWRGSGHTLESLTGDTTSEGIASKQVFAELQRKNHVFFLFQRMGAYTPSEITPEWEKLIGKENVIVLDDPAASVEAIAALIARFEGGLNDEATKKAMLDAGGSSKAVSTALAAIEDTVPSRSGSALAKTTGDIDTTGKGADRL